MRVLLFSLEYKPFKGGIATYYENIVKYWPERSNIFVLNNNQSKLVKNWLFFKWLPSIWALWRDLKRKKIDYVLVGHILPLGTVAWGLSYLFSFKYAVILHGMDFSFACRSSRKKWLAKNILKRADRIICNSRYTREVVLGFLNRKQDQVIAVNPGVDTHITYKANNTKKIRERYALQNKKILLQVGRLVKRKGVDKVLEALPEVLKTVSDLIYVVLGRGEEADNYKQQIINRKLQNRVILITDADDEELNAWYELCDIFIMPARNINGDFEGFGTVYLEANLFAKPVIAGASGGVRDAVVDALNGLLVNSEDPKAIAQAIIRLANDENLRLKLGEQGRERALKEFSWEKQISKIYDFIVNKQLNF